MATSSTTGKENEGSFGKAVDAHGNTVMEPSENVKALSEASNKRQDDLREAYEQLFESKIKCANEISDLRAKHQETLDQLREGYQEKIARAESARLDSIRQVDREEVAKTAVSANTAISTLAKQTTDLATTLQKTVTDTATAAEARNSAQYTETNKRLSALELSSSEGKGKQTVVDPQMDKLTVLVERLAHDQAGKSGKSEGADKTWGIIAIVATLILSLGGVGIAFVMSSRAPAPPQVIYAPPPTVAPTR